MKVSTETRGSGVSSNRQVTLTITGVNNIDFSRTADMVMNIPYTRMLETMRMVHRMGGRITAVNVCGSGTAAVKAAGKERRKKTESAPQS